MDSDYKKAGAKHCYACIQWEGKRTFDPIKKTIKVKETDEGKCLIYHKKVKGSHICDHFEPLR